MTLHVAVAGWLAEGYPSGAQRRLRAVVGAAAAQLRDGEQLTWLGAAPHGDPRVGFQPLAIPAAPTLRRVWAERRALPRALRALAADVLDLGHLPVPPRIPCPVCLTIHDLRDLSPFRRRPRGFARRVLRRSVRRAAHVVVPSAFTAGELSTACAATTPVDIVRNGVDREAFTALAPAAAGYILHVGHLEARKNLDLLVRAHAALSRTAAVPPRLLLAGADRGAGPGLLALARALGTSHRVELRGVVPEAELAELYAGAGVVAVPSRYEGFGLTALEGLAAGRPVVVSDRGPLPEVLAGSGQVVAAEDVEAWAAALTCALRPHPARAERGQARARELSWSAAGTRMLELWRLAASPR